MKAVPIGQDEIEITIETYSFFILSQERRELKKRGHEVNRKGIPS